MKSLIVAGTITLVGCMPVSSVGAPFVIDMAHVNQPVMLSQAAGDGAGHYIVVETRDGREEVDWKYNRYEKRIDVTVLHEWSIMGASPQFVARIKPGIRWARIEEVLFIDARMRIFKIAGSTY